MLVTIAQPTTMLRKGRMKPDVYRSPTDPTTSRRGREDVEKTCDDELDPRHGAFMRPVLS